MASNVNINHKNIAGPEIVWIRDNRRTCTLVHYKSTFHDLITAAILDFAS